MFQKTFYFKIFGTRAKIFWDVVIWSIIVVSAFYKSFTSKLNKQNVLKNVLFAFLKKLNRDSLIGNLPLIFPNLLDKVVKTLKTTSHYIYIIPFLSIMQFPLRSALSKLGIRLYKHSPSQRGSLGSLRLASLSPSRPSVCKITAATTFRTHETNCPCR